MNTIGHLIVWGSLAFIIYYYFKSKKDRKRLEELAFMDFDNSREKLYNIVGQVLGNWEENCLREDKIWTSMPKPLLLFIKGRPHDIKESVTSGNRNETWYYKASSYKYRGQTKYKYGFQVNLHNNIVTGWSDI